VVCIGVPYGTSYWQVGDSPEQNGCYKMALTSEKAALVIKSKGTVFQIQEWRLTKSWSSWTWHGKSLLQELPTIKTPSPLVDGDRLQGTCLIIQRSWQQKKQIKFPSKFKRARGTHRVSKQYCIHVEFRERAIKYSHGGYSPEHRSWNY